MNEITLPVDWRVMPGLTDVGIILIIIVALIFLWIEFK